MALREILEDPVVRTTIVAGAVALIGAAFALGAKVFSFMSTWINVQEAKLRGDLADRADAYARAVTPGVSETGALPAEFAEEFSANATEFMQTVAPERMNSMPGLDKRILARTGNVTGDVEAAKTGAAAGVTRVVEGQG